MNTFSQPDILSGVLGALRTLRDPEKSTDIVSAGRISQDAIRIEKGRVSLILNIDRNWPAEQTETLHRQVQALVSGLPGVTSAHILATTEKPPQTPLPQTEPPSRPAVAGHVLAIASGKGGVGKSTVAINLAIALSRHGRTVGLLDADIHGPSLPRLLGLTSFRPVKTEKGIEPAQAFGLSAMSIGFMLPEDGPVVWRGPMVQSAILQMLNETQWNHPDILLIDMPPGTGDAQIAIARHASLNGAVIVSTPQDVALADARKGLETFRKLDIPIVGLVENMSVFTCPCCGTQTPIFGQGGAEREAERLGVPFLGALPILPDLCALSDQGTPVAATKPDSPASMAFSLMAEKILHFLQAGNEKPIHSSAHGLMAGQNP